MKIFDCCIRVRDCSIRVSKSLMLEVLIISQESVKLTTFQGVLVQNAVIICSFYHSIFGKQILKSSYYAGIMLDAFNLLTYYA